MDNDNSSEFPDKLTVGDAGLTLARAGLSAIPIVGGAATELLDLVIVPPLDRRRINFLDDLAERISNLEQQESITYSDLENNEQFITTFLHATATAIKNHQQEKLEALRNAVLNAALPSAPDEARQSLYIRLIDEFDVWHLKILALFEQERDMIPVLNIDDANFPMEAAFDRLLERIQKKYPQTVLDIDLCIQIIKGLRDEGLIANSFPNYRMTPRITRKPEITSLGQGLLDFIRSPLAEDEING